MKYSMRVLAEPTKKYENVLSVRMLGAVAGLLAAAGVFALPLLFPPSHPSISASYTAGFNNRVASLAAAGVSFLVLVALWWFRHRVGREPYSPGRIEWRWFVGIAIACTVFTAVGGFLACASGSSYNDNRYFIDPMDLIATYHKHIYTDFAFLYGPLLLYLPVGVHLLLRPFHVGVAPSYYVALAIGQIIGLLMLFYVVNALPARRSLKITAYVLFGVQTLSPLFGLNYSFIRGALPFTALVLLARVSNPWLGTMLAAAAEMLALGVSPEVGIAFAAGAFAFSAAKAYRAGYEWLATALAPLVGAAVFLPLAGPAYLDSLALFSRGALNLIVEPVPYMLIFLFGLVWLAPAAVANRIRDNAPLAPMLAGFYLASLALVSPAFGRCDPLHVMFNGLGVYLLSIVTASAIPRPWRLVWISCVAFALLSAEAVNFRFFRHDTAPMWHWAFYNAPHSLRDAVIKITGKAPGNEAAPDVTRRKRPNIALFERWTGSSPIATPIMIPYEFQQDLKRTGHYVPDYNEFFISVCDRQSEEQKIEDLRRSPWVLVPGGDFALIETPENSKRILGFGFTYPHRRVPYSSGGLLELELAKNWTRVAEIGDFDLYRQNNAPSSVPR